MWRRTKTGSHTLGMDLSLGSGVTYMRAWWIACIHLSSNRWNRKLNSSWKREKRQQLQWERLILACSGMAYYLRHRTGCRQGEAVHLRNFTQHKTLKVQWGCQWKHNPILAVRAHPLAISWRHRYRSTSKKRTFHLEEVTVRELTF